MGYLLLLDGAIVLNLVYVGDVSGRLQHQHDVPLNEKFALRKQEKEHLLGGGDRSTHGVVLPFLGRFQHLRDCYARHLR